MGTDLAGVVTAVGADVRRFTVGDAVYARPNRLRIGSFAERIAVHEDEAALKPQSLGFEEAASLPLVALTSRQAMLDIANIQPGHKVLIHAGGGGKTSRRCSAATTWSLTPKVATRCSNHSACCARAASWCRSPARPIWS
nr:hypothetical protein [Rhodoferax sp.]